MASFRDRNKLSGILNELFEFDFDIEESSYMINFQPKLEESFAILLEFLIIHFDLSPCDITQKIFPSEEMREKVLDKIEKDLENYCQNLPEKKLELEGANNVVKVDFLERKRL